MLVGARIKSKKVTDKKVNLNLKPNFTRMTRKDII